MMLGVYCSGVAPMVLRIHDMLGWDKGLACHSCADQLPDESASMDLRCSQDRIRLYVMRNFLLGLVVRSCHSIHVLLSY